MARQLQMAAQFPPISLLAPAADAAGRTSVWRSLRNCAGKAWIVAEVNQGNAATVQLSLSQAKDVNGTSSKAINATAAIWLNNVAQTADALTQQTSGASFTTDATTVDKIVLFEIDPSRDLDLTNGFNHIAITTGASNAANITRADLYIYGSIQSATPPTSVI